MYNTSQPPPTNFSPPFLNQPPPPCPQINGINFGNCGNQAPPPPPHFKNYENQLHPPSGLPNMGNYGSQTRPNPLGGPASTYFTLRTPPSFPCRGPTSVYNVQATWCAT